jgi:flagellar motor switch protein FliN/FliY
MATEGMDTNEVDELSGWAEALEEQKKTEDSPHGDVQGGPLSGDGASGAAPMNDINMVLDIPVQLSVELGRTKVPIKYILQLGQGSVVELDALAGEPMDVLVNGYLIAQGEVVVVNEKFGIRLTDVVTPSERLKRVSRG